MIHLRVADTLLSQLDGISETEFIMGNIAPDSGVPNGDWSEYNPSKDISHFFEEDENSRKRISIQKYIDRHFTKEMQKGYIREQYSFYLGYLVHLMTDILWVKEIDPICIKKSPEEYRQNPEGTVWKWKKEFFDLDALFLRENPDFRAFAVFSNAKGFKNQYMDIFSPEAFDNRREYITDFYCAQRDDLDREYVYITEKETADFVKTSAQTIKNRLSEYIDM